MSNILDHFPYETPRPMQAQLLETLADVWDQYDVFVVTAPTGAGKTAISKTIMDWTGKASYIAPTNQLIDQFLGEFPETHALHSIERYQCIDYEWQSCGKTRRKEGGFCRGCPCAADIRQATWRNASGIYNYWTYLARRNELYRPTLIVDEAHNLIELIQGLNAERIWQHQAKYPNSLVTEKPHTIAGWIESLSAGRRKGKKLTKLYRAVTSEAPEHIVERTLEMFNGKGTRRGQPEERDCIRLTPIDIRDANPVLWPRGKVEKIVLLSATISEVDIQDLGLDRRRVCYLDCDSPIPAVRRPTYLDYQVTVSHQVKDSATRQLAEYIDSTILPQYVGVKGLIHSTYEQAQLLRKYCSSDRLMFHDQTNKMQIYEKFRQLPERSGATLVACGMQEGVDLPEDAGRFQVVAKIPWPSLADGAIRHRAESDGRWYTWNTLRDVIQACGRICRTPSDRGDTIILDGSMNRLLTDAARYGIIPKWFAESIVEIDEEDRRDWG